MFIGPQTLVVMIVLIHVTNDLLLQQLLVILVPRCLSNLTSRWMNYSVYYFFPHPGGSPYASVRPSVHLSVRPSACADGTHAYLNCRGKKEANVRSVKKIPQEDLNIKRLKSSLHLKFQACDCHTTAPNTPVKATMPLQFQAREINSTLHPAESNKVAVISSLKTVSYLKIWMQCSCGR